MRRSKTVLTRTVSLEKRLEVSSSADKYVPELNPSSFHVNAFGFFACYSSRQANTRVHNGDRSSFGRSLRQEMEEASSICASLEEIATPASPASRDLCTPCKFTMSTAPVDASTARERWSEELLSTPHGVSPSTPRSVAFFGTSATSPDVLSSEVGIMEHLRASESAGPLELLQPGCLSFGGTRFGERSAKAWRIEGQSPCFAAGDYRTHSVIQYEDIAIDSSPALNPSCIDAWECFSLFPQDIITADMLPSDCLDKNDNIANDVQKSWFRSQQDSCCLDVETEHESNRKDLVGSENNLHQIGFIHSIRHVDEFAEIAREAIDRLDE